MKLFAELGLILKSQWRSKGSFLLLSVQVAITLAVLVNALALAKRSQEIIDEPTGMDSANIIAIHSVPFDRAFNDKKHMEAMLREDLQLLRNYPGVIAVTVSNSVPGDFGSNNGVRPEDGDRASTQGAGSFAADEQTLDALGIDLVAGRNFLAEEIFFSNWPMADKNLPQLVILTQKLADALYPNGDALNRTVEVGNLKKTVIGIVGTYRGRNPLMGDTQFSAFFPGYISGARQSSRLLVRVEPGTAGMLIPTLETLLLDKDPGRDIEQIDLVTRHIDNANGMYAYGGIVLLSISGLLIVTTALGIFGTASFSVTQRFKQIGTRRALGATRNNVMAYFFLENLITTCTGILLGVVMAFGLNMLLTSLGLGRADWTVTLMGIVFVLLVGQGSVLLPAYRAASISPAEASRGV